MDPEQLLESFRSGMRDTLIGTLGIEVSLNGEGQIFGKMPIDRRTVQPFGLLHGGASVSLAETLGSIAANLHVDYPDEYCVGIEVNANHLRSVKEGFVYGAAEAVKLGNRIQVWEIHITDDEGELICVSRLTLLVRKKDG